ncbi:MAG: pentapeptide repeat-containing protein, partial [Rhodospirillales bacterium]
GVAPEELLRLHALWAQTGGAQGKAADLSGYDCRSLPPLAGLVLVGLRAEKAILVGLDLRGCQLQGARLMGADLRDCKLAGADLRGVNLTGAKLTRADLRDCDFSPLVIGADRSFAAKLDQAALRAVDLRGAKLGGASLDRVDLRDAIADDDQLKGLRLDTALLDARAKARLAAE